MNLNLFSKTFFNLQGVKRLVTCRQFNAFCLMLCLSIVFSVFPAFGSEKRCASLFGKINSTGTSGDLQEQDINFISELLKPEADVSAHLGEVKRLMQQINHVVGQNLSIPSQLTIRSSVHAKRPFASLEGEITIPLTLLRSPSSKSLKGVIAHEYGHVLLHDRFRASRSSVAWIFDGKLTFADTGDAAYQTFTKERKEIAQAWDRADRAGQRDESKRLSALQEEHYNANKGVLKRYEAQKKIANRFYNEVINAYDEFFADVVAVSMLNDPQAILKGLTAMENFGEFDQLRDFTSTTAIPDIFTERRASSTDFIFPMLDTYFHLTPARRAVWKIYSSQPGIDRGNLISAVADAIILETARIYETWSTASTLPSVTEMNARLIDEIGHRLSSTSPTY